MNFVGCTVNTIITGRKAVTPDHLLAFVLVFIGHKAYLLLVLMDLCIHIILFSFLF